MRIKNNLKNELKEVKLLIKNEVITDKSISKLYGHVFKASGKQIRSKLSLISSSLKANKQNYKKRIALAAVIELLHSATLVHDDVIDESSIRRGQKSINNLWSNSHGVLIGDFIYSKAFILMVKIKNLKLLEELSFATNDISKGELIQLDAINNIKIKLDDLLEISYYKTGRLFEAAAKSAAYLIDSNLKYTKQISKSAKYIGIIFQIKDDLLDYQINEKKLGKPSFQDIKESKITYPFYFAYKNANIQQKKTLRSFLGNKSINKSKSYKLIDSLNGIVETKKLLNEHYKNANFYIKKLEDNKIRKEMLELLELAILRDK